MGSKEWIDLGKFKVKKGHMEMKIPKHFSSGYYFFRVINTKNRVLVNNKGKTFIKNYRDKVGEQEIEETANNNILVYPNPIEDLLHIDINQDQIITVNIIDLNGRVCISYSGESIDKLDVSSLVAGQYYLVITQGLDVKSKLIRKK